jgi:leader peptidase (prepilin peptidase)/N-methyltransferase
LKGSFKKAYFGWKSFFVGASFVAIALFIQYLYFKNFMIFNFTSHFVAGFLFLVYSAAIVDFKAKVIPDLITYPLILFGFTGALLDAYFISMPYDAAIGAMVGYLLPSMLGFVFEMFGTKNGIGSGDIKFMSGIGAWLGLYGLIYSVIFACGLSIVWTLIKRKKQFAFAPFCAGGVLIYLMFLL